MRSIYIMLTEVRHFRGCRCPGTYALILRSSNQRSLVIGRLGVLSLRSGYYIYIGSAFGPGGLRARLKHHRQRAVRPHWHVDYLRRETRLTAIWCTLDQIRREHDWARILEGADGLTVAMDGFGASDCTCRAHLFFSEMPPVLDDYRSEFALVVTHTMTWTA